MKTISPCQSLIMMERHFAHQVKENDFDFDAADEIGYVQHFSND